MRKKTFFNFVYVFVLLFGAFCPFFAWAELATQTMLEPASLDATDIMKLWWVLLGSCSVVALLVTGTLLLSSFRDTLKLPVPSYSKLYKIVLGAVFLTIFLLIIIIGATFRYSQPYQDATAESKLAEIEVVGHMWWWEFRYLDEKGAVLFKTANEVHIPVNRAIKMKLTSADVIHSFWVPKLGGKMDLVPGQNNYLWLKSSRVGRYRGQCAEFCGRQHALMAFSVIAHTEEMYLNWKREQTKPASFPVGADSEIVQLGQQVFRDEKCMNCHAIRGMVNSQTVAGPDLTHLASRSRLAADTIPNSKGHLAGWILNSQAIKPGNLMPIQRLNPEKLDALVTFLQELK